METLSQEHDTCSVRSKRVDLLYIMGVTPVHQRHSPLLPLGASAQTACQQAYSTG